MSQLQTTKVVIEEIFKAGWTDTPIHYSGQEFDGKGMPKWINLVIKPSRIVNASVSNMRKVMVVDFYVPCWADNENKSFELADSIIEFVETSFADPTTKAVMPNRIEQVQIIDQGWNNSNKSFVVVMFSVIMDVGNC